MQLTTEQTAAYDAIMEWVERGQSWIFTLAGWAGVGKTTLVQHIINNLNTKPICCAPTGKAASVLGSKLKGVLVQTVHSVLYVPCDKNMSKLDELIAKRVEEVSGKNDIRVIKKLDTEIAKERDRLANMRINFAVKSNAHKLKDKLIIVDESSMVDAKIRDDLKNTGAKVLFVGDGFQLPPVGSEPWFINYKHDARLTTVMRQSLESPIIRLSIQIRERNVRESDFTKGDCILCSKNDLTYADWIACDQVITGRNNSRHRVNRFFRKQMARDHSHLPVKGDKLICLKNDFHQFPPWINGVQCEATEDARIDDNGNMGLFINYEGANLDGIAFYEYPCLSHYVATAEQFDRDVLTGLFICDYAYAVTCHKAQGSEWDFVIVADDKMNNENKDFRAHWLYTAATRAKSKLIIAQ